MIIVNQDRTSIYNFNNIKSIDVIEDTINVTDNILSNSGMEIAKYKTEERAKEVLEEIIKSTTVKQVIDRKLSKDEYFMIMKSLEFNIYEMPLE